MHLILGIILLLLVVSILTVLLKIALYLFCYLIFLILAAIFFGGIGFLVGIVLIVIHAIYTYKNDDFFN